LELEQRYFSCFSWQYLCHHEGVAILNIPTLFPLHDFVVFQARNLKEEQLKQMQSVSPTPATQKIHTDKIKALSDAISSLDSAAAAAKEAAQRSLVNNVRVLQRHHFSSALQRMSVVVTCQGREPFSGLYCLVKGSPEALLPLMDPAKLPSWWLPITFHSTLTAVCHSSPVQVHFVLRITCSQGFACAVVRLQESCRRPCRRRILA
jgi:hypothetical protein